MLECEEISAGETLLVSSVDRLIGKPLLFTLELIDAWNHLGVVWSNRDQHAKAMQFLKSAERSYHDATVYRAANSTADLPSMYQTPQHTIQHTPYSTQHTACLQMSANVTSLI